MMHSRPFHYWAWLHFLANIFRAFTKTRIGYDFRFVMNEALVLRAVAPYDSAPQNPARRGQGLSQAQVVGLPQKAIREIFNTSNVAILEGLVAGQWASEQVARYGELVASRLGDFVPDIIITWTPVPFLSHAFPDSLVLSTECGPFSRAPYPMTTFLDPYGLWAKSIPCVAAPELLQRTANEEERRLLERIRTQYRSHFESTSPFHGLETQMRKRHRRLCLLPLQFAGEPGFELNSPFRNQGEYLFHVLERLPADLGLLVIEHPTAHWIGDIIDDETREYVRGQYPQVTFVDWQRVESAGQYLIHHVDYVISISSSLGLQAVFWSKPLAAVGWSHLQPYATFNDLEHIDASVAPEDGAKHDGALAWLFRHYYMHEHYGLHSAEWLDRFFRTCKDRLNGGSAGLELYDPIAPTDELVKHLCSPLRKGSQMGR